MDVSGWQAFYSAVLTAGEDEGEVRRAIGRIFSSRRSSDEEDAGLLFHTFAFLSENIAKKGNVGAVQEITDYLRRPRQPINPQAVVLPHNAPVDRVWNLLKVPDISDSLSLIHAAMKMTALYHTEKGALLGILRTSAVVMVDLGLEMAKATLGASSSELPLSLSNYLERGEISFPPDCGDCSQASIEKIVAEVDELFYSGRFPAAAILSRIQTGLSISKAADLRICSARLLVRLARAHQHAGRLGEGLLILDDVESVIRANCSFSDVGNFYLARAELLLALAAKFTDDSVDIRCDALKSLQNSVAAFDRSGKRKSLLAAVALAANMSDKLGLESLRNFYSVKFLQIKAADEEMSERFFPCQDGIGQPRILLEIAKSPRSQKSVDLGSPTSPVGSGRGLQTLIKWTHQ
jgi:hypothetical protein